MEHLPDCLQQHPMEIPNEFLYPAHVCPPFASPHFPSLLVAAVGVGRTEEEVLQGVELGLIAVENEVDG